MHAAEVNHESILKCAQRILSQVDFWCLHIYKFNGDGESNFFSYKSNRITVLPVNTDALGWRVTVSNTIYFSMKDKSGNEGTITLGKNEIEILQSFHRHSKQFHRHIRSMVTLLRTGIVVKDTTMNYAIYEAIHAWENLSKLKRTRKERYRIVVLGVKLCSEIGPSSQKVVLWRRNESWEIVCSWLGNRQEYQQCWFNTLVGL